jgi:hypothetical protein
VLLAADFSVNFLASFCVITASYKPNKLSFFIAKNSFLGHFTRVLEEVLFPMNANGTSVSVGKNGNL